MTILPKTFAGKEAIGFIGTGILLFVLMQILVALGQEGGETFFSNLVLAIPGLLMVVCGLCGLLTGAFSVAMRKERSVLVFVATAIGLLFTAFVVGDLIAPN
jgi:predicted Abi (CAAX) family protease